MASTGDFTGEISQLWRLCAEMPADGFIPQRAKSAASRQDMVMVYSNLILSITDGWSALKYLWLLPSQALVSIIHCDTNVSRFLRIDCLTGAHWGGFLFSALVWFLALSLLAGCLSMLIKWRRKRT